MASIRWDDDWIRPDYVYEKEKYPNTNGYNFYLKYTSKNKLQFPVSPETLKIESPYGVNKVDVAHRGQFTQLGFRQLKSIEFSSFFPQHYNSSYCTYKFKKGPDWHRHRIEAYRDKRKPLYFVVPALKISMKVLVDDFSYEYRGGQDKDIYFTLKLTQYKEPPNTLIKKKKGGKSTSKKSSASKSTGKKSTRASSKTKFEVKKGQTHTVESGDTLQKIAKKYYGDTTKWRDIYALNKAKIGSNPNVIKAGQKLVIKK